LSNWPDNWGAVNSGNRNQGYGNNSGKIVYPYNVDLTRAFPDFFQQFWRLNKVSDTTFRATTSRLQDL
jgi:hypothetical protein